MVPYFGLLFQIALHLTACGPSRVLQLLQLLLSSHKPGNPWDARDNVLAHCSPLHPLSTWNRYVKRALKATVIGISNETLTSSVASAADSIVFRDSETGFTFSQYNANYKYNSPDVISIRTAVPNPASTPYDIVLQVIAKKDVGWLGIAWGGTMLNNPLTMAWANGNSVTVSSRWTKWVSQSCA